MGRGSQVACVTCKTVFDIGYGSCSTWLDHARTVAEFDAMPEDHKSLDKNQAWRAFLVEHEAHEWQEWSEDWASCWERDGRTLVIFDHDDATLADVTGFAPVDLGAIVARVKP